MSINGLPLQEVVTINHSVLGQLLAVVHLDTSADNAPIGDGDFRTHIALALKGILIADATRFHRAANFKYVAVANAQDACGRITGRCVRWTTTVGDGGVLLHQAILAQDDGSCFRNDGRTGMNNASGRDGDVAS